MKKYVLFFLFFFTYALSLCGQQKKLDSLTNLLKLANEDTNKVKMLNAYTREIEGMGNYPKGDSVAKLALALATKINFKRGIAVAIFNSAVLSDDQSNYPQALYLYSKARKMFEEMSDKEGVTKVIGNIGIVYWEQDDYPRALDAYLQALKITEDMKDSIGIARNTANIGLLYAQQDKYKDALDYYFKALEIDEKLKSKQYIEIITGDIGIAYHGLKNNTKALEYHLKAIEMSKELGDESGVGSNMGNIGSVYGSMGEYNKALLYYNEALRIDKEIGNKRGYANNLSNVGNIYQMEKDYKQAEKYLLEARTIGDSINFLGLVKSTNEYLSDVYVKTNRWQDAYKAFKLSSIAKDSIMNQDKSKQIGKLEAKADYDKQLVVRQAEEDKNTALSAAESKKQKIVIAFIGAIALGIACLALVVFRSLKTTRKQKNIIEEQKIIVEEKNKDITDSITYASRIQNALLTTEAYITKYLPGHFILYKPRDIVSGDFYWAVNMKNKFWFACCDSTGHGVPGAFMSILNITLLNEAIVERGISAPDAALNDIRQNLIRALNPEGSITESKDGMDCVLCCIDIEKMEMQCAAANNPIWILKGSTNVRENLEGTSEAALIEIPPDKMPVGVQYGEQKPFTLKTVKLNRGDTVYLFSDGYADQFGGPKGKKFKYKQLQQLIRDNAQLSMVEQKKVLEKTLEDWKGSLEQVDDVLVIGIRV